MPSDTVMHIEITGMATARVKQRVHKRARLALDRYRKNIERVSIRLLGVADGGVAERGCRIRILLKKGGYVVAAISHSDLRCAVDQAVNRIARGVANRLERAREQRRRPSLAAGDEVKGPPGEP